MKRFLLLLSLLLTLSAAAQGRRDNFWTDLNDFLDMREDKGYAKLDSNYIGRYPYHWDARLFYTSTGLHIANQGPYALDLTTGMNHRVGVGLSYRGVGLSYSRALGRKLNFNFSADSYGKHFCIEYALRFTTGLQGSLTTPEQPVQDLDKLVLGESRLNLFYSFNPRFSYAAAMKQSKIQRRSAGSFIAALSWSVWDIVSLKGLDDIGDAATDEFFQEFLSANLFYNRISAGAGYGYNWVLGREHWLLHASLVPMWTVYDATDTRENGSRSYRSYPNGWISLTATARAGIYYRWSDRWSLGLSGAVNQMASQNHLSSRADGFTRFSAQDWQVRFSLGFRFGAR